MYLDKITAKFALTKLPEQEEPWGQSSTRNRFYKVCRKYTERFKMPPSPELLETLWTEALKQRN